MVVVLVMSVTAEVEMAVPTTLLLEEPTTAPLLTVLPKAKVRPRRKMARAATNFIFSDGEWLVGRAPCVGESRELMIVMKVEGVRSEYLSATGRCRLTARLNGSLRWSSRPG